MDYKYRIMYQNGILYQKIPDIIEYTLNSLFYKVNQAAAKKKVYKISL